MSKLILQRISYFNGKIIIQTSDAIPNTAIERSGNYEKKHVGFSVVNSEKILVPWFGEDWLWHSNNGAGYDQIYFLNTKLDDIRDPLELWKETLGKRIGEVFELEFKIVQ